VANRAETTITLTDAPDDDERTVITDGLRAYNETQAGGSDGRPLAILVRNPETKMVAGGLLGRTYLGLLTVERFFLPEDLRRNRLGSRILAMAEEEARRRGMHPRGVVHTPFSGAGLLSQAGLGGRRPDRLRAARPCAVLYDQEAVLNTAAEIFGWIAC